MTMFSQLCEIETDKATMGFETPEEGYVAKIFVEAGTKDIPIGKLLCLIVENEEDVAKFSDYEDDGSTLVTKAAKEPKPAAAPAAPEATSAPPPSPAIKTHPPAAAPARPAGDRPFASPAAKKMAQEKGLDLSQVRIPKSTS